MKIIEALKTIKANKAKVEDLIQKIKANSAMLSINTSPYGDVAKSSAQVKSWIDTINSVLLNNEGLSSRVHRINNSVKVDIDIGGKVITKTIDEWLRRRSEGVDFEARAFGSLTDRGLKEDLIKNADGTTTHVTIIRHYDVYAKDERLATLLGEKALIDSTLEIINATVDLVE